MNCSNIRSVAVLSHPRSLVIVCLIQDLFSSVVQPPLPPFPLASPCTTATPFSHARPHPFTTAIIFHGTCQHLSAATDPHFPPKNLLRLHIHLSRGTQVPTRAMEKVAPRNAQTWSRDTAAACATEHQILHPAIPPPTLQLNP